MVGQLLPARRKFGTPFVSLHVLEVEALAAFVLTTIRRYGISLGNTNGLFILQHNVICWALGQANLLPIIKYSSFLSLSVSSTTPSGCVCKNYLAVSFSHGNEGFRANVATVVSEKLSFVFNSRVFYLLPAFTNYGRLIY